MHSGFSELDERPNTIAFCCSINFSYNVMTEDVGIDDWQTSVTGCCSEGDFGSYVDAFCCPWCVIGYQASNLKEDGTTGCANEACVKSFLADVMCLNVLFLTGVGRCCVPWLGSQQSIYYLRKSVRQHYRLKEPDEFCTNDMILGCCCASCVLAQNTREIERVSGEHPGGCCSKPHPELQQKANEKHQNDMLGFRKNDPNVQMMMMMKNETSGNKIDSVEGQHRYQKHNVESSKSKPHPEPSAEDIYSGVAL